MKKSLFAAFAVVAMGFAACGNMSQTTEVAADSTEVDSVVVVEEEVADTLAADSVAVEAEAEVAE